MRRYFRIKNWRKFQHYDDRAPIWIKLYTGLRSDPSSDWYELTDAQRGQLVGLWTLAAQTDNCIPYDEAHVAEEILATDPVDLAVFADHLEVFESRRACLQANHDDLVRLGKASPAKKRAAKSASKSASNRASRNASPEGEKSRIEEEGGLTVEDSTREPAPVAAHGPPDPPSYPQHRPKKSQIDMLEAVASERALDPEQEARIAGVNWPPSGRSKTEMEGQVTTLLDAMKAKPRLNGPQLDVYRQRMEHDRRWEALKPHLNDPDRVAAEIADLSDSDERAAWGLLQTLRKWVIDHMERRGLSWPAGKECFTWRTLSELPEIYELAGIGDGETVEDAVNKEVARA